MKRTPFLALMALVVFSVSVASVAALDSVAGDFEGAYTVGGTICVVVPIRMAFEVHWKGKKEPEVYFFDSEGSIDGKTVFTTDPAYGNGAVRKFVFDDEALSRGHFIDRKGKISTVSRR